MRRCESWERAGGNPVKRFTTARIWAFRRRRATHGVESDEVRRGYARNAIPFARHGKKKRSRPISGILLRPSRAMTVIPLGRASPRASSHLPADSVGHVVVCLLGVAPRRDCRVSPRTEPARLCGSDPRLTADGRYPLRCPVESRLSSARRIVQRPSGLLRPAILRLAPRAPRAEIRRIVVERLGFGARVPAWNAEDRERRHGPGR